MKLFRPLPFVLLGAIIACGDGDSGPSSPSTPSNPGAPSSSAVFEAGTHRVGSDIGAGRYFSDPNDGCFWQRLSGFSGTIGDVIANEFISFNARQEIVQIAPSDAAFETNGSCGGWYFNPRHGMQAAIPPGTWLVGSQVQPGTYRAQASSGCYWERLRGFSGQVVPDVIANDFVASGSQQFVTIAGGDLGFSTTGACGEWTRSATLVEPQAQTLREIEENAARARETR